MASLPNGRCWRDVSTQRSAKVTKSYISAGQSPHVVKQNFKLWAISKRGEIRKTCISQHSPKFRYHFSLKWQDCGNKYGGKQVDCERGWIAMTAIMASVATAPTPCVAINETWSTTHAVSEQPSRSSGGEKGTSLQPNLWKWALFILGTGCLLLLELGKTSRSKPNEFFKVSKEDGFLLIKESFCRFIGTRDLPLEGGKSTDFCYFA